MFLKFTIIYVENLKQSLKEIKNSNATKYKNTSCWLTNKNTNGLNYCSLKQPSFNLFGKTIVITKIN